MESVIAFFAAIGILTILVLVTIGITAICYSIN